MKHKPKRFLLLKYFLSTCSTGAKLSSRLCRAAKDCKKWFLSSSVVHGPSMYLNNTKRRQGRVDGVSVEGALKMEVINLFQGSELEHWFYDRWPFNILLQNCRGWWKSSTGDRGQERSSKGQLTLINQCPTVGVAGGGAFWTQMKFSCWDKLRVFQWGVFENQLDL